MAAATKLRPGACECDRPRTAHDVRKLKVCAICTSIGIKLIRVQGRQFGTRLVHPRCLFAELPHAKAIEQVARLPMSGLENLGLCCLGDHWRAILRRREKLEAAR